MDKCLLYLCRVEDTTCNEDIYHYILAENKDCAEFNLSKIINFDEKCCNGDKPRYLIRATSEITDINTFDRIRRFIKLDDDTYGTIRKYFRKLLSLDSNSSAAIFIYNMYDIDTGRNIVSYAKVEPCSSFQEEMNKLYHYDCPGRYVLDAYSEITCVSEFYEMREMFTGKQHDFNALDELFEMMKN